MVASLAYIMVHCVSIPVSLWPLAHRRLLHLCKFTVPCTCPPEGFRNQIFQSYFSSLKQHLLQCAYGLGWHIM